MQHDATFAGTAISAHKPKTCAQKTDKCARICQRHSPTAVQAGTSVSAPPTTRPPCRPGPAQQTFVAAAKSTRGLMKGTYRQSRIKPFDVKAVFGTNEQLTVITLIRDAKQQQLQVCMTMLPINAVHGCQYAGCVPGLCHALHTCMSDVVAPRTLMLAVINHARACAPTQLQAWFQRCFTRKSYSNNSTWLRRKLIEGTAACDPSCSMAAPHRCL